MWLDDTSRQVYNKHSCIKYWYCGILLGDLLLKLNEKTLCGLAHHEVGEMFRTSPPLLKVVVLRRELNKNGKNSCNNNNSSSALTHLAMSCVLYSTAVPNATKQSEKKLDQDSTDKEVKTSTRHFKAPPAPPVRHHDSNSTITDSPETSEAEQHSRADSSEIHHDDGEESLSNDTTEQVKLVSEVSTEAASADNNNQKLKSISLEDNTSDATDGAETSSQTESSPRDFTQFTSTTTLESDSLDEIDVQPVPISIGVGIAHIQRKSPLCMSQLLRTPELYAYTGKKEVLVLL